jgi:hypothetical protein
MCYFLVVLSVWVFIGLVALDPLMTQRQDLCTPLRLTLECAEVYFWGGRVMNKIVLFWFLFVISSGVLKAEPCSDDSGNRPSVVRNYLTAMQEHRFADAFDFVTESMTDRKSKEDWASLQRMFYEGGGVVIYSVDERIAHFSRGELTCDEIAIVPNVLKSKDNFNNQGITEFELYTVVKRDGQWLVDSQETLFDQGDVDIWFPGEVIPEFLDKK